MGQLGWVWFGGLSTDIYCIPSNFADVPSSTYTFGKIDAARNKVVLADLGLPSSFRNNRWRSAVSAENKIYCIPTRSPRNHPFGILRTDANTIEITTFETNQSLDNQFINPVTVGTKIYCMPSVTPGTYTLPSNTLSDTRAVIIDTETDTAIESTLGDLDERMIFSRHVGNGNKIYSLRDSNSNVFGITNTTTNIMTSSTLGLPPFASNPRWNTAVSVGTKVYCIPFASQSGLFGIIDATTDTAITSNLGINASFSASGSSWNLAVAVGSKIYCIAQLNNVFCIINTLTNIATLTTLELPNQAYNWSSTVVIGTNIYCIPAFTPSQSFVTNLVAVIDTITDTATLTDLGLDSSIFNQYPDGLQWFAAAAVTNPATP